jgi:hypothetical protein
VQLKIFIFNAPQKDISYFSRGGGLKCVRGRQNFGWDYRS